MLAMAAHAAICSPATSRSHQVGSSELRFLLSCTPTLDRDNARRRITELPSSQQRVGNQDCRRRRAII